MKSFIHKFIHSVTQLHSLMPAVVSSSSRMFVTQQRPSADRLTDPPGCPAGLGMRLHWSFDVMIDTLVSALWTASRPWSVGKMRLRGGDGQWKGR